MTDTDSLANKHPALVPVAFALQGRRDFLVRKTPAGWVVQGELFAHCCPCAAANKFLKHKGPCSCGNTQPEEDPT